MKRPYKLILASFLCAAPLGALLPGCGGGGGSNTGPFRLETRLGIRFDKNNAGNLYFQTEDTASATRKIVGTLQILASSPTSTASPTATLAPGETPNQIDFLPAAASYIIKGNVTVGAASRVLNASGALDRSLPFTLRGTVAVGSKIRLEAAFREGTKVLEGTLLEEEVSGGTSPTATPGTTATPSTTATPGITITPVFTATPGTTATPGITATPGPTTTPFPTPVPTIATLP